MSVRRLLPSRPYPYGLHRRERPARRDLVFGPRREVDFVHGFFWQDRRRRKGRLATSRIDCWNEKIGRGRPQDARIARYLEVEGCEVCVVWGGEAADSDSIPRDLARFFVGDPS